MTVSGIKKICGVAAVIMGHEIALCSAYNGYHVVCTEVTPEAIPTQVSSKIAGAASRPGKVYYLHFCSPVLFFAKLICGPCISAEMLPACSALIRSRGKKHQVYKKKSAAFWSIGYRYKESCLKG